MNTLTALLAFASHITANWTPEESTILCTVHNHVDEGQDSLEQHRSETGCVRAPSSDETTSSTDASEKKAVRIVWNSKQHDGELDSGRDYEALYHNHVDEGKDSLEQRRSETGCVPRSNT